MQKVSALFLLLILNIGCSVNRINVNKSYEDFKFVEEKELIDRVKSKNLTNNGFFIQRAEVKIIDNEGDKRFFASIKYNFPDKYLISFRSSSGIEGARVLLTNDTVLINDRINKKLYYGSNRNLYKKYGLTASLLPVILGDFINESNNQNIKGKCLNGKLAYNSSVSGTRLNYIIDCKRIKAISANVVMSSTSENVEIKYEDFSKNSELVYPQKIVIKNLSGNSAIEIHIVKMDFPWSGNIDLIPGNKFEILQIK